MTLDWTITNFLAAVLLPPLGLLLAGVLGWALLWRRPRLGRSLVFIALAGLWLLSTPIIAARFLDSLAPPFQALDGSEADAIVILGGGRNRNTLEYGGDTILALALERVRYGAWLAHRLHKPVLVTGGKPDGDGLSEGQIMQRILATEFNVPVRWVENASANTRENARLSAGLLHDAGIRRIYLVSQGWHLARAVPEFEAEGFSVVPAGIGYKRHGPLELFDFVPSPKALLNSYYASHEWLGLIWYRLRH